MCDGIPGDDDVIHEVARLRKQQADEVMPLIGGLLDAWNGLSCDLQEDLCFDAPELTNHMEMIRSAMEVNNNNKRKTS